MRIKNLVIPEHITTKYGLKQVEMKNLGNVVILAGKNGSGKTRLLNLIKNNQLLINDELSAERSRRKKNLDSNRNSLKALQRVINNYKKDVKALSDDDKENLKTLLLKEKETINEIFEEENNLNIRHLEFYDDSSNGMVFEFVPKKIEIKDPDSLTKGQLKNLVANNSEFSIEHVSDNTYGIIQALQDFVIDKNSIDLEDKDNNYYISSNISRYESIIKLVHQFLTTEVQRDRITGDATLFKRFYITQNCPKDNEFFCSFVLHLSKVALQ